MVFTASQAAVTGAIAQQERTSIIANNIANIKSNGFKKMQVHTSDLFYTTLKKAGNVENPGSGRRPSGIYVGSGARIMATSRNLAQGAVINTGRPLDVMITGLGYFAVQLPNGRVGYKREGAFKIEPETRNIVTLDGKPLANNITVPENISINDINISKSGAITAPNPNNPIEEIEIGQLDLFVFPNEHGVEPEGDGVVIATTASGEAQQVENLENKFLAKALEGSNSTAIEELVDLIDAQRGYELNSRVIRVSDEMQKDANNIKG